MVDTGQAQQIGARVLEGLIGGTITVLLILLIGGFVGGLLLYLRYRSKFDFKVRIESKRGSGTDGKPIYDIFYDKGGIIFKKKDKRKFFRILREKVDLPVPPQGCWRRLVNGKIEVGYLKENPNTYLPIISEIVERGYSLDNDGKTQFTKRRAKIIEDDVDFWGIQRKKDNKQLFDLESTFMKLVPYIPPLIIGIIMVFALYILLDKLPAIISVIQQVASELNAAASTLKEISIAQAAMG